jgi:hypothetical protein
VTVDVQSYGSALLKRTTYSNCDILLDTCPNPALELLRFALRCAAHAALECFGRPSRPHNPTICNIATSRLTVRLRHKSSGVGRAQIADHRRRPTLIIANNKANQERCKSGGAWALYGAAERKMVEY